MSYPRTIWLVRHAEREDNININWRGLPSAEGLSQDNPPLSERGRVQSAELGARFKNEEIGHVFASPFDRTIDTASVIIAANANKSLKVKSEPGLAEALYLCDKPPSFWEADKLKQKYPLVDEQYVPLFTKLTMPREGNSDDACIPRLRITMNHLIARYSGNLLLVGHGASIGSIHQIFTGEYGFVGQATVSKFVEKSAGNIELEFSNCASHLSDRRNLRA